MVWLYNVVSVYIYIFTYTYIYIYIYIGGWGGESFRDPNREIDFGFVFVHVSCVRAKLCAMIPLWLGAAKLFCPTPAPPPPAVGGRTSRDVPSIKTIDHQINDIKQSAIFVRVFPVKSCSGPRAPKYYFLYLKTHFFEKVHFQV